MPQLAQLGEIVLGDIVRDSVTKFEGMAISATEFLNACRRIAVQPVDLDKDGKIKDAMVFDEPQLFIVKPKTPRAPGIKPKNGGPGNPNKQASINSR